MLSEKNVIFIICVKLIGFNLKQPTMISTQEIEPDIIHSQTEMYTKSRVTI